MLTRAHLERARLDRLTSARASRPGKEKNSCERRRDGDPRAVWRSAPFASHTTIRLSSEHVAILRSPRCASLPCPHASNAALQTVLPCPPSFSVKTRAQLQSSPPESSSHTRISSSYDTDTSTSSVGCHLTCFTSCVCPCSTATHSKSNPGWTSQIHTVLSRPHVASSDPLGDHAHDLTSFS